MKKIAIFIASIFIVFSGYFMSPAPLAYAQTNALSTGQLTGQTNIETALSSGCSIIENFSLCVLSFIYHVILGVSFYVVGLVANLFDFFLGYTLNSEAYQSDFITKGWGIIRDIANVAFIFTLLYLAIRHILGMSAKKYIPTLIIVALLLNFSLFFTKVVIDAGNILARAFYQSITIENDEDSAESGYRGISVALVEKINPQRLLSEAIFTQKLTTGDVSTSTGGVVNPGTTSPAYAAKNLEDNMAFYVGIFLLLAFVNFSLAGVFLSVALLMVGRTIGLWFAMIFSPIAFITLAVPGSGGFVKQLSFDTWKDTVLKLSFLAPIFIFFLYLTIMFLTVFFETPIPVEDQDTFMRIMAVFIPFMFVIVILRISKKTAEDMAGEIGGTVKSLVGKALGAVGGVALGGAAMVGRSAIGGFASAQLKNGRYEARIADATEKYNNSKGVEKARAYANLKRLELSQSKLKAWKDSSWDVRNADKSKMLGGVVGSASGFIGGKMIRPGMNNFGGKDFNVGKGSKESRGKYEDDKEKEELKIAEDRSNVSFLERNRVIENQKDQTRQQILELKESKKTIEEGFSNETKEITKRLDELVNKKGALTDGEEREMENLIKREKEIPEAKKKALKDQDSKIETKEKTLKDDKKLVEQEQNRRRNIYADKVREDDLWGLIMGIDNKELANKMAKGDKVQSDEDKAVETLKKSLRKEMENEEKEKEAEKPKEEEKE